MTAVAIHSQKLGRLKKRAEFLHVRKGKYKAQGAIVVQARKSPVNDGMSGKVFHGAQTIRVGFTATKKIGNAVTRNRAKRRLREVARAVLPRCGMAGYDYVFIARGTTALRPYEKLMQDAEKAVLSLSSNPDSHAPAKPR